MLSSGRAFSKCRDALLHLICELITLNYCFEFGKRLLRLLLSISPQQFSIINHDDSITPADTFFDIGVNRNRSHHFIRGPVCFLAE